MASRGLARKVHRQAASALKQLLAADGSKKGGASLKKLTLGDSMFAKKSTYALTCQTLKYVSVLRHVLTASGVLGGKQKVQPELAYVLAYDLLFGQGLEPSGDAEQLILSRKTAIRAELARLMVKKKVKSVEELLPAELRAPVEDMPRYVRVNTLKMSVEAAVAELAASESTGKVERDDLLPDLLVLPPGTDMHAHPRVLDGSLILQGKASCMPAHALAPRPDWLVIDACAAPGNKSTHLSALMHGKGRIIACDADAARLERLRTAVHIAGASNVDVRHQDFLRLHPSSPEMSKVRAVLLDPSCSGSGTKARRMDHLMPSASASAEAGPAGALAESSAADAQRLEKLARFQEAALRHALSFPNVQRVVYSTCSVHQRENEDVVKAVLPLARKRGMHLQSPFDTWHHRGLPVLPEAHHLVRLDSERDKTDGFFIALFVREGAVDDLQQTGAANRGQAVTRAPAPAASPSKNKENRGGGGKKKHKLVGKRTKEGAEADGGSEGMSKKKRKGPLAGRRSVEGGEGEGDGGAKKEGEDSKVSLEAGQGVVAQRSDGAPMTSKEASRLRRRRLKRLRRKNRALLGANVGLER